ncbi:hypothetical protein EZS27_003701 [termite gut metagenome]|uniref:DUF4861 domain-containing protein n=1 Tax=termite gut metagenome TaxID=433724 RepID=A0A5J4STX6_9ZZZZ
MKYNLMKKTIYLFFASLFFLACSNQSQSLQVIAENSSDFERNELIEIPLAEVTAKLPLKDGQVYEVRNSQNEIIPSQSTFDGKLLFQSTLKTKETARFTIAFGEKQNFQSKTFGRLVTERYDDFAWENDRVAFRIYGQALVPIDGPSNGLDIWYKRTNELVINNWYKNDLSGIASYHNDNGEGLDDYKVGRTLGAGAMAPFFNDSLWLNENFVSSDILDNGPLRTTFKLIYKDIRVGDQTFSENRLFSIDAGAQLSKVTQEYGTTKAIPVSAGIVKRESGDSLIISPDKTCIEYLEPKTDKAEGIYIGLVFPQGINRVVTEQGHILVVTTYQPNQPLVYYTGYGWNQFGFTDANDFQTYLENFVKGLKQPLIVSIN